MALLGWSQEATWVHPGGLEHQVSGHLGLCGKQHTLWTSNMLSPPISHREPSHPHRLGRRGAHRLAALATAFENIAVDKVNADILVDEKIDTTLINYLNFDENNVKACAVFAVAMLAKNVFFKETFAQNGIEILAKLLDSDQ